MRYVARILRKSDGFSAELIKGFTIEVQKSGYVTQLKAAYALNRYITEYNKQHNLAIPHLSKDKFSVEYHSTEPDAERPDIQPSRKFKAVDTKPKVAKNEPTVCDTPQFNKAQRDIQDSPAPQPTAEALQDKPSETAIQDNAQAKSRKVPKRKPFTPYGLSGYLVDNNGNIRLMLDRKAQASTIVLAPTMFNALAEMVRKTQEQNNALPRP